jgi:hypothetical protein
LLRCISAAGRRRPHYRRRAPDGLRDETLRWPALVPWPMVLAPLLYLVQPFLAIVFYRIPRSVALQPRCCSGYIRMQGRDVVRRTTGA